LNIGTEASMILWPYDKSYFSGLTITFRDFSFNQQFGQILKVRHRPYVVYINVYFAAIV